MRVKVRKAEHARPTREIVERYGVHTVCQSARCPNIGECFGSGTATFMVLGGICTRNCGFCAVGSGKPEPLDPHEPERVARAAAELGLDHVVVTSVTRDDLEDGGAQHFAATIRALQRHCPGATVEVLTPDFGGDGKCVATVCAARPDIYNHNVETVARLQSLVRPQADYGRSLGVLRCAAEVCPSSITKSGFMVGIGETDREVDELLRDLRRVGCQVLTIGQYLQPSPRHVPVDRYVPPEQFDVYAQRARDLGFAFVASGPFVRSSYRAKEACRALQAAAAGANAHAKPPGTG
jgi:lipoic acid synthetase